MSQRALWHVNTEKSELRSVNVPANSNSLVEVQSAWSTISLGTERLVSTGKVPESLEQPMKVPYMEGSFGLPVKYGYSLTGVVASSGSKLEGKPVHVMHPHQERVWVREEDCFVIPENVPLQRATLASNMETALTALWDAEVKPGERVLITGFGMIGSMIARLAHAIPGTEVDVLDINENRASIAAHLGFTVVNNTDSDHYDLAFHCSASDGGLHTCLEALRLEGRLVEMSWYGNRSVQWPAGKDFHYKRIRLISSQVSHLPSKMTPAWNYSRRKEAVFRMLADPIWDKHIDRVVPFDESPAFFNNLRNDRDLPLAACIRYDS